MTGRRRRELTDSFRLVAADERWLPSDLFVGAIALVVWVAGTGALVTQAASVLGIPLGVGVGEAPSLFAVGVFAGLWLVVPGAAFIVRVRQRMLNLRGNVEQYYRMDHPAVLLVPPAILVVALGGGAFALGRVPWYLTLLAVPVGLFALVRTLAFSYRVYGFSHPLLVQAGALVATVLALGGAFGAIATPTGTGELVQQSLWTLGLSGTITGQLSVGPLAVTWPSVAVLAPVAVTVAYVFLQTIVALGVRVLKPAVDRSKMRTGQRYPPFLHAATPVSRSQKTSATPASQSTADSSAKDGSDDATGAAGAAGSTDAGKTDDEEEETDDEDLDDVSNTRVFTPPSGGASPDFDSGVTGEDRGDNSVSGATGRESSEADPGTGSQTRAVPSADPSEADDGSDRHETGTADREHCVACGESFTVDTAVRFCPNCGAALEGE